MILLTGGAGYIGSHCVKRLMSRGYEVAVLDNLSRGFRDAVVTPYFYEGDIGDRAILEKIFNEHKIEAVMHFSAFAAVGESVEHPDMYYKNNVAQTLTLITACRDFGVNNFIFSSTCATYGDVKKVPISEDTPIAPLNPYGWSKRMVELILDDFSKAYGMHYCIFRYFNAAGADPEGQLRERHDPETHLIPLVLQVASGKRQNIKVFGTDYPTPDGTCIRDYIHVVDLAKSHVVAVERLAKGTNKAAFEVFNIGTGNGFSVMEVIKSFEKMSGVKLNYRIAGRREGDIVKIWADTTFSNKELGWKAEHTLDDMTRDAWNWEKQLRVRN